MIIELLLGAGLVTLGVVAVRALRREEGEPGAKREQPPGTGADSQANGDQKDWRHIRVGGPRGLRVDDVLLYADDELWLAGEIHLDEEGFVMSLFRTPGSPRSGWLAQLDPEGRDLAVLSVTDDVPGGAVPTELPFDGLRLALRKRGHADVRVAGDQLPPVTERARYALLGGPGGRTLVVVDFEGGDRLALGGERVSRDLLDLLPGGEAR